jgi:uncharacterized protein YndB with AHSA1/START domain
MKWNAASDDWECPQASNDCRTGGTFSFTMAAKDKSFSFDFAGTYTNVEEGKLIEYTMGDGRKARVVFVPISGNATKVTETFDAETEHSEEMQRAGWQAILENFKKHAESQQ